MKNTYRIALLGLMALTSFSTDATAQRRAGSIYNPEQGPFVLVGDRTARRPGDLVTIVISENQDVRNEESSDLSTQKGLAYQLSAFDLKPNMFSTLPTLQSGTEDVFHGSANYEKTGTFSARMTAVVIDKLPFAAPDDPVMEARSGMLRRNGGNHFTELFLPQAVIALKQGVGRLIRDADDRGVLAICDPRLFTARYGPIVRKSLPPMPVTRDRNAACAFLDALSPA